MKRTFSLLLFVGWIGMSAFPADSTAPDGSVPFKLYRGHLIAARCSIGGLQNLIAIIDTGTSETVLDLAVAQKLGLSATPDVATFVTHNARVWAVTIPELQLGRVRVERLDGIAADLSSLTTELGIRPQVLIGMDVLHRANFVIDYQGRKLVFGEVAPMAHSARLLLGDPSSRLAVIESTMMRKPLRLQVDSGFEGVLLYRGRMAAGESQIHESRIVNVAQTLLAHTLPAADFNIGDWHSPSGKLTVVDQAPPESAEFDGLIGTAFLSQRRVAFDFQHGMIYWE